MKTTKIGSSIWCLIGMFAAAKSDDGMLLPEAIAETYWQLHCLHSRAWSHKIDLRKFNETFRTAPAAGLFLVPQHRKRLAHPLQIFRADVFAAQGDQQGVQILAGDFEGLFRRGLDRCRQPFQRGLKR